MEGDAWRQCVDWLIRCRILPPDHRLTSPDSQLIDLAHLLKDGVILCHLLNKLKPGTLDPKDYSQRPQLSQFLCLKNAKVFLMRCKSDFAFNDADLFEPTDLCNPNEFGKVLHTLSMLSLSEFSQQLNIEPFKLTAEKSYYNVKETTNESSCQDDDDDDDDYDYVYTSKSQENGNGDIYCILVDADVSKAENAPPKTKRDFCIQELIETEKKYVQALKMIKLDFMKPLCKVLSTQDYQVIFKGIEDLWTTHNEFEINLKATKASPTLTIPDCFISNKEKFLFYGEFCSNLTPSQELIDKLCLTSPNVQQKIQECEMKANDGRFKLRDLLALPMQRILKYHLFLKELIKNTDDGNEKVMLERALEEIQDLSLFINEVKRDNETLSAMHLVENSIIDLPPHINLKDSGRLVMDGELKIKILPDNSLHTRQLFLFDMIILMCKSKGDASYNFKDVITVSGYDLEEAVVKEKGMFGFNMTSKSKTCFVFFAKKENLRQKWFDAIQIAQSNVKPEYQSNSLHNFSMASFDKPTICDVCRKLLRGVFYQGYRCERTNMAVHKECLKGAKNMTGPPTGCLPPRPSRVNSSPMSPQSPNSFLGKVKAYESYNGVPAPGGGKTPLRIEVGDVIVVLSEEDRYWIEGESNGQRGFFPKTAVRSILNPPLARRRSVDSATPPERPSRKTSTIPVASIPRRPPRQESTIYINSQACFWYVGGMSRDDATLRLESTVAGTYLIRVSVNDSRKGEYALSIKTDESVKHMRIGRDSGGGFYLAQSKIFQSLVDLVDFYATISLERLFPEVKTPLLIPYYTAVNRESVGFCIAMYDYSATAANHLSLHEGDRVEILSKTGEARGWWRGRSNGKSGYFPIAYVKET